MMNTWKNYLIILLTTAAGVGIGYLLFNDGNASGTNDHSDHGALSVEEDMIWTCSMHPQIRQPEPGLCPLCAMDLIPLSGTSSQPNSMVLEMTADAMKLANIQTIAVGNSERLEPGNLMISGKIQADERRVSSQVAHVPGRIEKLYVTYTGERIKKGQKLATIYSPELVSAQRELIEAVKWKENRPQLLEAARNKLRYWRIQDEVIKEVEESGKVQLHIPIYADHSGIVSNRRIAIGDYIKEGTVLFEISDLSRLWVLFDAYEEDLSKINIGNKISFTLPAIPGRTFSARVSFIDPIINSKTRVASIRAEVSNPSGILKPEMFVRGSIESGHNLNNKELSVPKTAVLWTGPRSVVYTEIQDADIPSFTFREVTVGEAVGDRYIILEGLEPGERVVVNGAFVIDGAAQLNNMSSMMNRHVDISDKELKKDDYSSPITDSASSEVFKVYGNCSMCKKTIEGALIDVDGIYAADWNTDSKMITVSYEKGSITLDDMKKRIAAVGYDTDRFKAEDEVYNNLHTCCQYERPEK